MYNDFIKEQEEHKETSLEELYDYLRRFSLSDSLLVISIVNNAFKYGLRALNDDTHQNVIAWLEEHWKEPIHKINVMLLLTRMARFLLLSAANDYKSPILDTGTPEMHRALFLVSSLYDKDVHGEIKCEADLARVLGRIGQWQFPLQVDRGAVVGRGYLLFVDIPSKLSLSYDFDRKMQEYFGITVFQFITSGLAAWMMSTGVLKYKLTIDIDALKGVVTTETLDKFVELSSGTPEDYRRHLRGDDWKIIDKVHDIYGLDPMLKMPAIRVERSGKLEAGQYVVPQPLYLLLRASLGVFHLLSDKEHELAVADGKTGKNDFREAFGQVYREYVGKQLALASNPVHFVDLDREVGTLVRKPDFALVKGDTCALFEVKTALLTVTPRMQFEAALAKAELEVPTGNFKKAVDQLNAFEAAILRGEAGDSRFVGVTKIIKVIVGFEDMYLANTFLLPIARDLYGEQVDRLQIGTLSDIEIIGARLAHEGEVVEVIWEKVSKYGTQEDRSEWSLGMYVAEKTQKTNVKNPVLDGAFKEFISLVSGCDYADNIDPFATPDADVSA